MKKGRKAKGSSKETSGPHPSPATPEMQESDEIIRLRRLVEERLGLLALLKVEKKVLQWIVRYKSDILERSIALETTFTEQEKVKKEKTPSDGHHTVETSSPPNRRPNRRFQLAPKRLDPLAPNDRSGLLCLRCKLSQV